MSSPRLEFFSGVKAELPLLVGVVPFGMIYGVLALGAGIPVGAAQAMSVIVFAGSAQFVTTQLVHASTPAFVIVLTVAVVNLRHALYSASLAPYLKPLRPAWKWILAYLLTDEAYAVTIMRYQKDDCADGEQSQAAGRYTHWFYLGAGLALWSSWQASTAAGILLGNVIPESWSLDFTLALTFIALVVPALRDRSSTLAALLAGLVAVLGFALPYKIGLILAAVIGVAVGLWSENGK